MDLIDLLVGCDAAFLTKLLQTTLEIESLSEALVHEHSQRMGLFFGVGLVHLGKVLPHVLS